MTPRPAATNLVTNPSFEVDTAGWTTAIGLVNPGATIDRVAESRDQGEFAADIATTGINQGAAILFDLEAGVTYNVRVMAEHRAGTGSFAIHLIRNSAPFTVYPVATVVQGTVFAEFTAQATPSVTAEYALVVECLSAVASAVRVDGCFVSTGEPYFDGDTLGARWLGARHASQSFMPASIEPDTLAPAAARLYEQWEHLEVDGESEGWPWAVLAAALAAPLEPLYALLTAAELPWGAALDPTVLVDALAPLEAAGVLPEGFALDMLAWVGQFAGIDRAEADEAGALLTLQDSRAAQRGGPGAIIRAAKRNLSGPEADKRVTLTERYRGNAYSYVVATYASQTPDPAAVLRELLAARPAGRVGDGVTTGMIYRTDLGWSIGQMEAFYAGQTIADLEGDFATIHDLETRLPD